MSKNYLAIAINLASEKFLNKVDKAGDPYIFHCLSVMYLLSDESKELQQIAVLHDIIEDTDITPDDLYEIGFSSFVVEGIITLTHTKKESYDDYIKRIKLFPEYAKVKIADLVHNMNITRLKILTDKDIERFEKYQRAFTYLSKI